MIPKLVLLGTSLAIVASQAVPPNPRDWEIFGNHGNDVGDLDNSNDHGLDWNDGRSHNGPVYPGGSARHEKRDVDIYIDENDDDGDAHAEDTIEGRDGELRENDPVGVECPQERLLALSQS
ncbi:hypothetical protein AAVH_13128 [Aphelenchoides avenae]|nr:hypothetical protein AAVH_13128 [Aphelenchus avenae]